MQRDLLVCFLVFFFLLCVRVINNNKQLVWFTAKWTTTGVNEYSEAHLQQRTTNPDTLENSQSIWRPESQVEELQTKKQQRATWLAIPSLICSSITTNDLSCARHRGAKPWSCFPERRGVMDFYMPKLFEMLMEQRKQTRGEHRQTPASLRRMQRCRRKNDSRWWTVRTQRFLWHYKRRRAALTFNLREKLLFLSILFHH